MSTEETVGIHSPTQSPSTKFEIAFQACMVAQQEAEDAAGSPKEFMLHQTLVSAEDKQGIKVFVEGRRMSALEYSSIKHNLAVLAFGVLVQTTKEAMPAYLKERGVAPKVKSFTGNMEALFVILACMRNAFGHNPTDPRWNIRDKVYKGLWIFQRNQVHITLDLSPDDKGNNPLYGQRLDFDKHLGGFGQAFYLLYLCRKLFDGSLSIDDINKDVPDAVR